MLESPLLVFHLYNIKLQSCYKCPLFSLLCCSMPSSPLPKKKISVVFIKQLFLPLGIRKGIVYNEQFKNRPSVQQYLLRIIFQLLMTVWLGDSLFQRWCLYHLVDFFVYEFISFQKSMYSYSTKNNIWQNYPIANILVFF